MDINKILTQRRVNLNMQATNKEDAIQELADLLYDDGALTCKEDFIQDVWQREAEGSTGFENHIAVPHGKSQAVKQTTLAIGQTAQDIPRRQQSALHHLVRGTSRGSEHHPYSSTVAGGGGAGR